MSEEKGPLKVTIPNLVNLSVGPGEYEEQLNKPSVLYMKDEDGLFNHVMLDTDGYILIKCPECHRKGRVIYE